MRKIREPDRSVPYSYAVAARSHPLPHDGIGLRRDSGNWNLKNGDPNGSFSEGNFAAGPWNPHWNSCCKAIGLHVDSRDAAVALVERPNRAGANGQKTRPRPYGYGGHDSVRLWVYVRQQVVLGGSDPHAAFAEGRRVRPGGYRNFRDDLIRFGIDAGQPAIFLGNQPHA